MLTHFPKLIFFALLLFISCEKENPAPQTKSFEILFDNELNELQIKAAAWFSDADGKVLAFRWLNGDDTTRLVFNKLDENLPTPNLTLAKYFVQSNGVGNDTTVTVNTFTAVKNGSTFHIRNQEFRQTTQLKLTFPDAQSVDTIIVPDGLTYSRPGWWNNYYGEYRCFHTGNLWFRLKVNGDDHWRYLFFKEINQAEVVVQVPTQILPIEAHETPIPLPFDAPWKYRIEGLIDVANRKFLPLGDLERAPGGAQKVFDTLLVFEPIPFDPVAPPSVAYSQYRLAVAGQNAGEGYFLDDIFQKLPTKLPVATFDINPAGAVSDGQNASANCFGDFDAFVFSRKKSNPNSTLTWETWQAPQTSLSFKLPEVPDDFGKIFPDLKNYNFDGKPRGRAEGYRNLASFDEVLTQLFDENNPFWKAQAGFLGRDEAL